MTTLTSQGRVIIKKAPKWAVDSFIDNSNSDIVRVKVDDKLDIQIKSAAEGHLPNLLLVPYIHPQSLSLMEIYEKYKRNEISKDVLLDQLGLYV